MRCPWQIQWGMGPESHTWCDKDRHITRIDVHPLPDGRISVDVDGDPHHSGPGIYPGQRINWQAGDRREHTGGYPGPCMKLAGCTLHTGHHGRCAP